MHKVCSKNDSKCVGGNVKFERKVKRKRLDIFAIVDSYPPFKKCLDCFPLRVVVLMVSMMVFYYFHTTLSSLECDKEFNHHKFKLLNITATQNTHEDSLLLGCKFEQNNYYGLWIFFYLLVILTTFIGIAIICDDFFVPSLETISERLNLSEDVAGATFMAAGSSAPELFTSVVGVTYETDVGVGTIVGSALFNIFIIIAFTGLLSKGLLELDWKPLARDCFFYFLSVSFYIGFSYDGYFEYYEAICLLILYALYILLMFFNQKLMRLLDRIPCKKKAITPETVGSVKATSLKATSEMGHTAESQEKKKRFSLGPGGHARRLSLISQKSDVLDKRSHFSKHNTLVTLIEGSNQPQSSKNSEVRIETVENVKSSNSNFDDDDHPKMDNYVDNYDDNVVATKEVSSEMDEEAKAKHSIIITEPEPEPHEENVKNSPQNQEEEEQESEDEGIQICCCNTCPMIRTEVPSSEDLRNEYTVKGWLKFILKWFLFIEAFPFVVCFSWTIPDCGRNKYKKYFIVSFIVSVSWIAIISYAMVTCVTKLGCILNINDYTMGLVIIAIGTSVPDAISSILVAREGYGDMAVSNAIGSNVFDINLGLGLPFLIKIAIDGGKAINLLSKQQRVGCM